MLAMSGSKVFLRQLGAILLKDLRTEWRSREILTTTSVFAILVILIFHFAIGTNPALMRQIASGVLWITLLFSTVLGLQRAIQTESGEDCLQGILLALQDYSILFLAKMIANVFYLSIVSLCTLPLFSIWIHLDITRHLGMLIVVFLLGIIGFSIIGTLFSFIIANIKMQESLFPLLFLPITVPLTIAAVYATAILLDENNLGNIGDYVTILVVFDVIFFAIALMVFDYIVEE